MTTSFVNYINGEPLSEPVSVNTFEVDGHYYASSSEYMVFTDSTNEGEALEFFVKQLEDMYNRYSKLHNLLGK